MLSIYSKKQLALDEIPLKIDGLLNAATRRNPSIKQLINAS
jgi:hypothetical protein